MPGEDTPVINTTIYPTPSAGIITKYTADLEPSDSERLAGSPSSSSSVLSGEKSSGSQGSVFSTVGALFNEFVNKVKGTTGSGSSLQDPLLTISDDSDDENPSPSSSGSFDNGRLVGRIQSPDSVKA